MSGQSDPPCRIGYAQARRAFGGAEGQRAGGYRLIRGRTACCPGCMYVCAGASRYTPWIHGMKLKCLVSQNQPSGVHLRQLSLPMDGRLCSTNLANCDVLCSSPCSSRIAALECLIASIERRDLTQAERSDPSVTVPTSAPHHPCQLINGLGCNCCRSGLPTVECGGVDPFFDPQRSE